MPLDPCLAVIPARGGSKGLPGKNVRPLAGLPLLAHSLRCAALVHRLARTIVTTDDEQIGEVARAQGGIVPFRRPRELAADDTPMIPVLRHALTEMERLEGRRFESLLLLDPTSPFRLPSDVDAAFALLDADDDADGVVACSAPRWNPYFVGVVERAGFMAPALGDGQGFSRRQDAPRFLRINGSLYLWRRRFILEAPDVWTRGRHRVLETPERRALSIDDLEEFQLAETLLTSGFVELPWLEGRR